MKKILLIIFTVLSCYGFSQHYENFMSISMGGAVPFGDFASTDIENTSAGYAETSLFLSFDGAHLFLPYIGIGGTMTYANNSVDQVSLRTDIIAKIKEQYPDFVIPEDTYISFDAGVWNHVNVMVGPQFTLPLDRLNFDLRALGGLSFIFPPEMQIYLANEDEEFRKYFTYQTKVSFGYLFGAAIRYNTSDNMMIRLMADYTYAKTTYTVTDEYEGPGTPDTGEYEQPIGTWNIGIGIGYYF